jgi:hypothetical protein
MATSELILRETKEQEDKGNYTTKNVYFYGDMAKKGDM